MRAGFLYSKFDDLACLHTHQDKKGLIWKDDFFAKINIFCKSIVGPLSETNKDWMVNWSWTNRTLSGIRARPLPKNDVSEMFTHTFCHVHFLPQQQYSRLSMNHISHSVGMLINKNVVFGGSENPQVIEEGPHYIQKKITVWCALCSEGVIGWDAIQYVSKSDRKFPQKNQCLQQFAWKRSFKWCTRSILHIKSKFEHYK